MIALAIVVLAAGSVLAEDDNGSEVGQDFANSYRLDLAVPESPALNVLANRPSRLLRPSTVRDLGVAFEDFLNEENQFRLPATFGAEFAPALLIGGPKLTIKDYRKWRALYRTRLSVGTGEIVQGGSARQIGVGLRTTLTDQSDLRTNDAFLADVDSVLVEIEKLVVAKRKEGGLGGPVLTVDEILALPDVAGKVATLIDEHTKRWPTSENWNKTIWELAFAWGGSTTDETVSKLVTDNWGIWTTYGAGMGSWGQWLFGLTGESRRHDLDGAHKLAGTFSTRLYAGGNSLKGFLEGQFTGRESASPIWFVNGGGEVKVRKNLWFTFQLGYEEDQETGAGDIRADLAVNLGVWAFPLDVTKLGQLAALK